MRGSESEDDRDLERISESAPLPAVTERVARRSVVAWEPVTPGGVAAFGLASYGRVWLVGGFVALLAAGATAWSWSRAWAPVVEEAIQQLPASGHIEHGQLVSPRTSPEPLARNPFLGIGVDLDARSSADVGSDLYVKFHRSEVWFCSFLGHVPVPYPEGVTIQFNRPELEPRWGAWRPMLLGMLFLATAAMLLAIWWVLGLVYGPVLWVIGRARGQRLGWGVVWRVGVAANLPGALLFTVALLGYGLGGLPLAAFCVVAVGHVFVAWIYVWICPRHLPMTVVAKGAKGANPFDTKPSGSASDSAGGVSNVFRPGGS